MRVLLPPSETKVSGGGSAAFTARNLGRSQPLSATRGRVFAALEALCAGTDPASEDHAAKVLKLGVRARGEIAHNRALGSSPTMPAIERYDGVLFDALGVNTLGASARAWLDEQVSIQSALFGLIDAGDLIPAYRLSASSALPVSAASNGSASLKRLWRDAHADLSWPADGLIVDLRSKDYASLAPLPADANAVTVEVATRTAEGRTRALNHFNKQAKGDLVRRLARSAASIADDASLIAWADAQGLEMVAAAAPRTLTLVTELGAPSRG